MQASVLNEKLQQRELANYDLELCIFSLVQCVLLA